MQDTHQDQERTRHKRGYAEPAHAVFLNYSIHNYNKRSCRTAYLHLASAKERDDETCYDSCENTRLRSSSRCDTECDGKWQSHYTYNYTCKQVLNKSLFVITVLKSREQFRLETSKIHKVTSFTPTVCRHC